MTSDFIPGSSLNIKECNYIKGCRTVRCGYKRANVYCIDLCKFKITYLSFTEMIYTLPKSFWPSTILNCHFELSNFRDGQHIFPDSAHLIY